MRSTSSVRTRPRAVRGLAAALTLLSIAGLAAAVSPAGAATKTTKKATKTTVKATVTTNVAVTTKVAVTTAPAASAAPVTLAPAKAGTIKLGFFPNVTHATGLVGVQGGFFQKSLVRPSRPWPRP